MSKPAEVSIPSIKTRTKATAKPAPFLRGLQATSCAVWPWTIRVCADFSTVAASNAFFRQALAVRRRARMGAI